MVIEGDTAFDPVKAVCEVTNTYQERSFEVLKVVVEQVSQRIVCNVDDKNVLEMEVRWEALNPVDDKVQHVRRVSGYYVNGEFMTPHEQRRVFFECELYSDEISSCSVSDQAKEKTIQQAIDYICKQKPPLDESQIRKLVRKFGYDVSKISVYRK